MDPPVWLAVGSKQHHKWSKRLGAELLTHCDAKAWENAGKPALIRTAGTKAVLVMVLGSRAPPRVADTTPPAPLDGEDTRAVMHGATVPSSETTAEPDQVLLSSLWPVEGSRTATTTEAEGLADDPGKTAVRAPGTQDTMAHWMPPMVTTLLLQLE